MPGSSTTPGRPGTRAHVPVRIAFHLRNSVGSRDMNLCEAQWLAYVLPYRRFAAALTDGHARLGADVDRYSVITSDLHRLLVAGLPGALRKILDTTPFRHSIFACIANTDLSHSNGELLRLSASQLESAEAVGKPGNTNNDVV